MEDISVEEALILAATKGTRMLPVTRFIPKCLLPVGEFPIIVRQLMDLEEIGIKRVHICLEDVLGPMVERSLTQGYHGNISITYGYENQLFGIGHTVHINKDKVGENFIVILADEFNTSKDFLTNVAQSRAEFVLGVSHYENTDAICGGCNVDFDPTSKKIVRLIEKPAADQILGPWCWTGFARFSKKIFPILEELLPCSSVAELDLTTPLQVAQARGLSIGGIWETGTNINITTLSDYYNALKLVNNERNASMDGYELWPYP